MNELLGHWETFYVIIGSSAGALIGLQFVMMTLIAQSEITRSGEETVSAFATPAVVHFCSALLLAAILTAPWTALMPAGLLAAACGVGGIIYSLITLKRARRQRDYQPVFEDWLWHAILPLIAYSTLLVAGALVPRDPIVALFAVGAASLLLVFIGVHIAWDNVTWLTMNESNARAARATRVDSSPAAATHDRAEKREPARGVTTDHGSSSGVAGKKPRTRVK